MPRHGMPAGTAPKPNAFKNSLMPGERLVAGGPGLRSENGDKQLNLLKDGNLYAEPVGRKASSSDQYWHTSTGNEGIVEGVMQADGNFVLKNRSGNVVWQTKTAGHPGAYLRLDNDVTVNIYAKGAGPQGGPRYWASHELSHDNLGDIIGDAAKAAGKAVTGAVAAVGDVGSSVVHQVADVASSIGDYAAKVPVIGGLLHGVWTGITGPMQLADDIAAGKRIDRALLSELNRQVSSVKEIAPYAQAVISFVPGIGPVASAAIAAGLSLAQGKPIDQALVDAIGAAIPGGALAKAAYSAGRQVITTGKLNGSSLVDALMAASPVKIPAAAKDALAAGVDATARLARGERLDSAIMGVAGKMLPSVLGSGPAQALLKQAAGIGKEALAAQTQIADALTNLSKIAPNLPKVDAENFRKALTTGLAVGQGQKLQDAMKQQIQGAGFAASMAQAAKAIANDTTRAARAAVGKNASAFDLAQGLMAHRDTSPFVIQMVRNSLPSGERAAFDAGLALHVGRVALKVPAAKSPAEAMRQAAYLTAMGAAKASGVARVEMAKPFLDTAAGKQGLLSAVSTVKANEGLLRKIARLLGLLKD